MVFASLVGGWFVAMLFVLPCLEHINRINQMNDRLIESIKETEKVREICRKYNDDDLTKSSSSN